MSTADEDGRTGVIALVPDLWNDVVMPRHQVLKRLARYFPTVWIEPAGNWREFMRPTGPDFMRADSWSTPVEGLDVLAPGWRHPTFYGPRWLRRASMRSRMVAARRRLLSRGATRIVLYLWRDEFADATDLLPHDASCYHIDDEYTFSETYQPVSPREAELLRRVDQVIVHSHALLARKGTLNPRTALIPNGVAYKDFSSPQDEPADLQAIPRPRIGYAGVIKKQLDLALLVRLAAARPDLSWVLVGPIMNVTGREQCIEQLRSLPNVHLLGSKAPEMLPAYMQHFDVCLMCYEVNDYTNCIYPLKLNEYLATGLPVVSSAIDAISRLGNLVSIVGPDDRSWLEAIDAALLPQALGVNLVAARQAHAREHDWDLLAERIAGIIRSLLPRRGPDPS